MDPLRFRPRLEAVEDRVTPAVTPTEVFFAAFQTGQTQAMLSGLLDHLDEPMNVYEQPFWASFLPTVVQDSRAAHDDLAEFANALQTQLESDAVLADALAPSLANARALQNQAANNAHAAGVIAIHFGVPENVVFPVPLPPPPPPAPFPGGAPFPDAPLNPQDESGMTDTVPSLAAADWEDIGGGLRIWDVVEGTGEAAVAGSNVTAQYTGWLADNGTVFDSTRTMFDGDGVPIPFTLLSGPGGVIDGWVNGIPGMKVGGIRRLDIPAALAYGDNPPPGSDIPPDARLVFEVKLSSVG